MSDCDCAWKNGKHHEMCAYHIERNVERIHSLEETYRLTRKRLERVEEVLGLFAKIDIDFIPRDEPFRHLIIKARAVLEKKDG